MNMAERLVKRMWSLGEGKNKDMERVTGQFGWYVVGKRWVRTRDKLL